MEDTKLITGGNGDRPEAQQHLSQCAVQDGRHRESKDDDMLVVLQGSFLQRKCILYTYKSHFHTGVTHQWFLEMIGK